MNINSKRILGIPISIWIVFMCAVLLRVGFVMKYQGGSLMKEVLYAADAHHYDRLAQNLIEGKGYTLWGGRPTSYRTPFYPLFLLLFYSVFGKTFVGVRIFQALLSACMCFLFYALGKAADDERAGVLAALFGLLYLPFTKWTGYLLTETWYLILSMASLVLFLRARRISCLRAYFFAGLIAGITILCRGDFGGFVIVMTLCLCLQKQEVFRAAVYRAVVYMCGVVLVVLPWTVRNTVVHKAFIPISTTCAVNLYSGNSEGATGGTNGWMTYGRDWELPDGVDIKTMSETEYQRVLADISLKYIREHPLETIRRWPRKWMNFYGLFPSTASLRHKVFMGMTDGLLYLAALVGLLCCMRGNYTRQLFFGYIVYYTGIITVLSSEIRYRLYIMPIIILFAAMGVLILFRRLNEKITKDEGR